MINLCPLCGDDMEERLTDDWRHNRFYCAECDEEFTDEALDDIDRASTDAEDRYFAGLDFDSPSGL